MKCWQNYAKSANTLPWAWALQSRASRRGQPWITPSSEDSKTCPGGCRQEGGKPEGRGPSSVPGALADTGPSPKPVLFSQTHFFCSKEKKKKPLSFYEGASSVERAILHFASRDFFQFLFYSIYYLSDERLLSLFYASRLCSTLGRQSWTSALCLCPVGLC